jgi:hypothetical protein
MDKSDASGRGWMWGIILSLLAFGLFFIGFAVWTFQTDVELMYDNYYDKDVVYEQQIRRIERADALPLKPKLTYRHASQTITIYFSPDMSQRDPQGTFLLFRPSDLNLDRTFPLSLQGDSLQTISVPDLLPGLWRMKLDWSSENIEYYLEEMLVVN